MLVSSPDRTAGALNAADAPVTQRRVRASLLVRLIRSVGRDPFAIAGAIVLAIAVISALVGPYISPYDPVDQDLRARLRPPFWQDQGSLAHPLGTDNLGRDIGVL